MLMRLPSTYLLSLMNMKMNRRKSRRKKRRIEKRKMGIHLKR